MDSEAPNKNVRRLLQGVVCGTKDQGAEETLQFTGEKDPSYYQFLYCHFCDIYAFCF